MGNINLIHLLFKRMFVYWVVNEKQDNYPCFAQNEAQKAHPQRTFRLLVAIFNGTCIAL